jgi:uncharacterized protein YuzE
MARSVIFAVRSPLGYRVTLTRNRWQGTLDKLRVYYDKKGNTLSVWFDDPKKEFICEESADDVVLVKDRRGRVIGFERMNFLSAKQRERSVSIPVEVQMG